MPLETKELGLYLKNIREELGYSTYDVNKKTNISQSYLSLMENGKRKPSAIILKKLAPIYNLDYLDLYEKAGYVDLVNSEKQCYYARIPVLGSIPAGVPIELVEDIIDYEDISADMLKGGKEYFAVKVKGNSMEPKYLDGDVLIVLKQSSCDHKQDCIVMVNGDDGTFKRVFISDNGIKLQPLNSEYESMFYTNEEVEKLPVKILGVVKEIRRTV